MDYGVIQMDDAQAEGGCSFAPCASPTRALDIMHLEDAARRRLESAVPELTRTGTD